MIDDGPAVAALLSFFDVTETTQFELGHDFDLSGSRDVIYDVIIRSAMGHFLLVGNWYQVSNSNRFRDICI